MKHEIVKSDVRGAYMQFVSWKKASLENAYLYKL